MPLPYVKPGVTVNELVSPSVQPVLLDPNVLCIVGPARGFQNYVEVILLNDHEYVTLAVDYADTSTLVIRDASDISQTAFVESVNPALADYDVDSSTFALDGKVKIRRSMQTDIADGQDVVAYFENDPSPVMADSKTDFITLNRLVAVSPADVSADTEDATLVIMSEGIVPSGDYTLTNVGSSGTTITWQNTAAVVQRYQKVWLDYTIADVQFTDVELQLNQFVAVAIGNSAEDIVVKTAPGSFSNEAVVYDPATLTTDEEDYFVTGTGASLKVARAQGSTTIGGQNDKLVVRVSYQATPANYFEPTRCFSQSDVEDKFGPAFDSQGNILTPVAVGSLFAFQNGSSNVVVAPIFSETNDVRGPSDGSLGDWQDTLTGLRTINDISIIVPITSSGDLATPFSDSLSLGIFLAVQNHIHYMQVQEAKFIMALFGEDSTSGSLASRSVLQDHADALSSGSQAEEIVLFNEGAFTYGNPVTGLTSDIGGQYYAAAAAGTLCRYSVQTPLTGKRVNGFTSIKGRAKSEAQKDEDAQFGLCVVETKRGRLQVRHGITTAQDTRAHQEISVVRARNWMLANIVAAFEDQAVGRLVLDENAGFLVYLLLSGELELLIQQGAIKNYENIQVRPDPLDPTGLNVQFSYTPVFPLNHINISFSINANSGVTFDQSTSTQGF